MDIEIICKTAGLYGGVKRLYRIAGYLKRAGHHVVINMSDGSRNTWFKHDITENEPISPQIRICPETYQQPLKGAKNILYIQAQFDPPEYGYEAIVTTTDFLSNKTRQFGYEPDYQIPYGFDSKTFFEDSSKKIKGRIGFMPRKGGQEIEIIKSCGNYDFFPIDGLDEEETVSALQSCDIFLAISREEGFGMPPFEAALCGCLVIGYHGKGGREWLTPETFVPCEFPQEFGIQINLALSGQYENQRNSLKELILRDLTLEKEREAWLNAVNEIK